MRLIDLLHASAVVTGASRGLGNAIARRLANEGCLVTLVARNEALLRDTLVRLPVIRPHQIHQYIVTDLSRFHELDEQNKARQELMQAFSSLYALINCAGATTYRLLCSEPQSTIPSVLATNVIAPIALARLAYKPMLKVAKAQEKPVILNVSSLLSFTEVTSPGTTIYAALKAAMLGFTQSLAAELKDLVRVNSILPGLISETGMARGANPNLPKVSLNAVVDEAMRIIRDTTINGQNVAVDQSGVHLLKTELVSLEGKTNLT